MSRSSKEVRFSFLTAGPTYAVGLPANFEGLPELSTPVSNGVGGREFVFLPTGHGTTVPDEYPVVNKVVGQDDRTVEVYQWPYDPPQWYLRWPLAQGELWSHLREEDGLEMAQVTAGALTVNESADTPFLLLSPPLRSAIGPFPGYQEVAQYLAPSPGWSIAFRRPSFVQAGSTLMTTDIDPDLSMLRSGSTAGLEIQCIGTDLGQLKGIMADVLGSLSESTVARQQLGA